MMATPGTHISGASSGQLRTSQLDPNAAAPTLFDADGPRILYATLSNLKVVLKLLEALQFKDRVTFVMAPAGFKVVVDHSKSAQTCAYLPQGLFRQYDVGPDIRSFGISLTSLLECLQFLAQADPGRGPGVIELRMASLEDGLQMLLNHASTRTSCKLRIYDPEESTDFMEAFRLHPVVSKVIMQAKWLKAAFDEMDSSSETVHLLISPSAPYLRLSTAGSSGSSEMDYPRGTTVIEQFQCDEPRLTSYRLKQLQLALDALALSEKVAIMVNERGFLKLQFMIDLEAGDVQWIEFYAAPLEPDDGDDGGYVPPPSQALLGQASGATGAHSGSG